MADNSPSKQDSFHHHHGTDRDTVLDVKGEQGGQIVQLRQMLERQLK